jgi:hypothetical protein
MFVHPKSSPLFLQVCCRYGRYRTVCTSILDNNDVVCEAGSNILSITFLKLLDKCWKTTRPYYVSYFNVNISIFLKIDHA